MRKIPRNSCHSELELFQILSGPAEKKFLEFFGQDLAAFLSSFSGFDR